MLLNESAVLHRGLGTPHSVPWCLEGLAGVAAARGDWERAARICGALDALRARLGPSFPPADPARHAATLADARAALGDDAFAAAQEAGRTLPLDRVLADAVALTADDGRG